MIESVSRPKKCPACGSRYFRHGDIAWDWIWERETHHELLNWQCVNCGAIVDKPTRDLRVVRFDRIVLAPGELNELRVNTEASP